MVFAILIATCFNDSYPAIAMAIATNIFRIGHHGFGLSTTMLDYPRVTFRQTLWENWLGLYQLIGLREKLQETPTIFMAKSGWFPVKIFPFLSTH